MTDGSSPLADPGRRAPSFYVGTRSALVLLFLFLLTAIVAIGGGAVYVRGETTEVYDDAARQVRLISDLKMHQLSQWRRERLTDAAVLDRRNAQSPAVREALANDPAGRASVESWLAGYLTESGEYDRAFLLTSDGTVRIAMPDASETPSSVLVRETVEAGTTGAPRLVDFYRDEHDGQPHLALVMPVPSATDGNRPLGAMVLRINPNTVLYSALEIEEISSATGETELIRVGDGTALFLNNLRHVPDAALNLRVESGDAGRLAGLAAAGVTGQVRAVDYQGETVLGFIRPVPDSPWILITRVDIEELDGRLRRHLWLVTSGVALLLLSVGASLLLWRRDQRTRAYRRQAELAQALRESEERLRLAVSAAAQGLYDLNLRTGRAVVSSEYAAMLGHDPASFVETLDSWRARVHPDERVAVSAALDAYLAGRAPEYRVEFRLPTSSGGWKWVLSVGQIVSRDARGMPLRLIGTHTDITQLKTAQEGQVAAAAQLRHLLANSPTVVYGAGLFDGHLRPSAVSENVERIFGSTQSEVMQPNFWAEHIHPDDRDGAVAAAAALAGTDEVTHEYRFKSGHGEYVWVQDRASVLRRTPEGAPLDVVGVWNDVTTSHEAEVALRSSEERLRLAMISARQGLWDLQVDTGEVVTSPEYATILGYDPAEFTETVATWDARLHPDDRVHCQQVYDDYVAGRRTDYELEFRQRAKNGTWVWIHSIGRITERSADGRPLRIIGIHTDITVPKQAEDTVVRLSRLYATLSRCNEAIVRSTSADELFPQICKAAVDEGGFAMAWVGIVNRETRAVDVAAAYGFGLSYLDGISVSADPASPLSGGPTGTAIVRNGPVWVEDFRNADITRPWHDRARQFGWVGSAAVPLTRNGETVGALTIYSHALGGFEADARRLLMEMGADISFALDSFQHDASRVQAQLRLKDAERRYRRIFENSSLPTMFIEADTGAIRDANHAAERFYGWPLAELRQMNMSAIDTIPPDELHNLLQRRLAEGPAVLEVRHRLASGEISSVEVFANLVTMDDHPFVLAVVVDVTARYRAEAALIDKEHQLSEAQRIAHVGSWTVRPDGTGSWSDEMFRLFGMSPGSPLPAFGDIEQLVHPDDRPTVQPAVDAVLRGDVPCEIEFRTVLPDGAVRYLHARGELRGDTTGPYVAGTIQDVTARHEADAVLRASLREKEALLKEVHHRVKNNLQVISSLLRLELRHTGDQSVKAVLGEMQNRVASMAQLHETLYRSDSLARVDLASYLTRLVHQLFRSAAPTSGRVTLHTSLDPTLVDLDEAVPCGLLVTELVSNSLKHAFPDNLSGEVSVSLSLRGDGPAVQMTIADTGSGLPADFDLRRAQSLGLQLVSDLARQLRGTLEITHMPGATFTLVFTPRATVPAMQPDAGTRRP